MASKLALVFLLVLSLAATTNAFLFFSGITNLLKKITSRCPNYPDYVQICDLKPQVERLRNTLKAKVNARNSAYKECKDMSTKLKQVQTEFGNLVDMFRELTFRVHKLISITTMRAQYGNFDASKPDVELTELGEITRKLEKLKTNINTDVSGFIVDFVENQFSMISMIIPIPIPSILNLFGIKSNKQRQQEYLNDLKDAKSRLERDLRSVGQSLARVQADCAEIKAAWPKIRSEVVKSLQTIMTLGADLMEAFPQLGIKQRKLNMFVVNKITQGDYSSGKVATLLSLVRWEVKYIEEEFYPKVNNALKDIFGSVSKDRLSKLVEIADKVVKQMKIKASLDAILSTIAPIDSTITIRDILRMQARLFPQRTCYRIYPLSPARAGQSHPTYRVPTTQKLYRIRDAIKNGLAFVADTCAGVESVRSIVMSKESVLTTDLFNYLLKTIKPNSTCVSNVSGAICT
ncbi:uncharacterized protein LOC106164095 [Lingula anatina]|uniref:Uncharacterized protein LOC106164095 n=1 Tax=Lingula anatina TaxID=7574 RepID=A0A1S3IIL4_LINAN|nr:uncharacterized protein LOC106164095 [Lingula anatina]|eukprot:XP_013397344.1 uncharacterized protein LOC106164095 [Lingula anatina]